MAVRRVELEVRAVRAVRSTETVRRIKFDVRAFIAVRRIKTTFRRHGRSPHRDRRPCRHGRSPHHDRPCPFEVSRFSASPAFVASCSSACPFDVSSSTSDVSARAGTTSRPAGARRFCVSVRHLDIRSARRHRPRERSERPSDAASAGSSCSGPFGPWTSRLSASPSPERHRHSGHCPPRVTSRGRLIDSLGLAPIRPTATSGASSVALELPLGSIRPSSTWPERLARSSDSPTDSRRFEPRSLLHPGTRCPRPRAR